MSKEGASKSTFWKRNEVRSGLEARVVEDLNKRKIPFGYETNKIPYIKKYCPSCSEPVQKGTYIPDFIIGSIIVEAKGRLTAECRKKHLSVRALNPDLDIRILFQRDQKISKNSTTRYSDWAEKNGFIHAFGESVPEEWIKDAFNLKRGKRK